MNWAPAMRAWSVGYLAATVCAVAGLTHAAAPNYAARRSAMVDRLRKEGLRNERVLAAMGRVPRHLFLGPEYRGSAYEETEIPIGFGEVTLAPHAVGLMTEALDPRPRAKILEIGTGCGYHTAVLAELTANVFTIEIRRQLADSARARLRALGYTCVQCKTGDGAQGWAEKAPFDGILVTCAVDRLPQPLVDQLADGGRIVVPIGSGPEQTLNCVYKVGGRLRSEAVATLRVAPMITRQQAQ